MTTSPESEIAALEHEWMDAWLRRDGDVCERILGDDFVLTSARGTLMSKPEWLAGAMGPIVGQSFHWDDLRVRVFGDMAIVHARTRQSASVAGQDWSGRFLITDVWARRVGRWQVVSRHGTGPLPETAQI